MTTAGPIACSARQFVASTRVAEEGEELSALLPKVLQQPPVGGVGDARPVEQGRQPGVERRHRLRDRPRGEVPAIPSVAHVDGVKEQALHGQRDLPRPSLGGLEDLMAAPQQMGRAGLMLRVQELAVGGLAIPDHKAGVVGAQVGRDHVAPPARRDGVEGRVGSYEGPEPGTASPEPLAGLIGAHLRALLDPGPQVLVRGLAPVPQPLRHVDQASGSHGDARPRPPGRRRPCRPTDPSASSTSSPTLGPAGRAARWPRPGPSEGCCGWRP